MSAIISVPFQGDTIEAVQDERGVWVSVRRICEALGLDFSSQLKKLKEKSWACVVLITTHDTSGRRQETSMISLDCLPMWLATVEESRVAESVKPKLVTYQRECAQVLRDHFFRQVAPDVDPLIATLEVALETRKRQLALEQRTDRIEATATTAERLARAAMGQVESRHGYLTILAFLNLADIEVDVQTAARAGRDLTALARQRGIALTTMPDARYGRVNLYPESLLAEYFADQLD